MTAVPELASDGDLGASRAGRRQARHRIAFVALALAIVVGDQFSKALVVADAPFGRPVRVLGDWLRIWYVHNTGALFGLFPDQAPAFALLSIAVIALIVWYHERALLTHGRLATLTLGLLLGGALGNFIDRIRLGHVVDFVDMGFPGGWRFYTWNVADSAITISILLLLLMAVLPVAGPAGEGGKGGAGVPAAPAGSGSFAPAPPPAGGAAAEPDAPQAPEPVAERDGETLG